MKNIYLHFDAETEPYKKEIHFFTLSLQQKL